MITLVSFDIDGTLEVGEPPGIITTAMIRSVKSLGCVVGTCSDRTLSYQQHIWEQLGIAADFTVLKHRLADIKARFSAHAYYHVGDTDLDDHFATAAGFEFLRADAGAHASWGRRLFGWA